MEGQREQLKKTVEDIAKDLQDAKQNTAEAFAGTDEELKSFSGEIKKMASEYTKDSASAKEAMGLTDAMVEGIYGQAYRLYNTGKYKEGSQLFRLLIMLDAKQPKYLLGLAACFHMLKEFKNAIEIYTLCGIIDPESPIPHYHASDCYIQMQDRVSAIIALEMAITRAGERPEYQTLKDRSQLTIENLKKELMPKQL
jgi:type III secretion system low calcium response chaperone LcrH/SycD